MSTAPYNLDALLDACLSRPTEDQRDTMTAAAFVAQVAAGAAIPASVAPEIQPPAVPTLAERLRHFRREAKLSSTAVGIAVGLAQSTVIQMEKGKHRPGPDKLVKLAALYGTTVAELTGDDPACKAAMALAGSPALTAAEHEFYFSHLVEQIAALTARVAALEQQAAARPEVDYGPLVAVNVPYGADTRKAVTPERIRKALARGPLYIDGLVNRFGVDRRAEIESALCSMSNELADGWQVGDDHLIMLEDVPEHITSRAQCRKDNAVWLHKVDAAHFNRNKSKVGRA